MSFAKQSDLIEPMAIDALMAEEILGPLLPIVKANHRQAFKYMQITSLGLYKFGANKKGIEESKQDPVFQSSEASPPESDVH